MGKLPSHILKALRTNNTSLGDHPAFPPEEEEKFAISLMSKEFDSICNGYDESDVEMLKSELSKSISSAMKLEKGCIESLEKLCKNIIYDIFDVPDNSIELNVSLVRRVDTSNERIVPEPTKDYVFDDIDDMSSLSDEIYKRRMVNALVAGAALYYMTSVNNYVSDVFSINSELPALYKKIIDYNNILLFLEEDTFSENSDTDGGKVEVRISNEDTCPVIDAQAVLFPVLLEECIKGILELAASRGLPENEEKAKYVMSKSDFKLAELWDMRLGYALWEIINDTLENAGYDVYEIGINFIIMTIAELPVDEFNSTLKEIFARTKKGKRLLCDLADNIQYQKDRDDFDDFIQSKHDGKVMINDDEYFTSDELLIGDAFERLF